AEPVDQRLRRLGYGDDQVGEHREMMSWPLGVQRAEYLPQGRPLLRAMGRRRRSGEEPGVVNEVAVVGVTAADLRDFREQGALVLASSGLASRPVTIEPVERRHALGREWAEQVHGAPSQDRDVRQVCERRLGPASELLRELDRDHAREDARE